jgi:hypothetical protein
MANFSVSLSREVRQLHKDIDLTIRTVLFKFSARLVERSPVGNPDLWQSKAPPGYVGGHFRAQWQHGFNEAPSTELPTIDPSGEATTAKLRKSVFGSPVAGIHWIVNMAPYAQRLEDGHSSQAPRGIVSLAILDFNGLLERSVPG